MLLLQAVDQPIEVAFDHVGQVVQGQALDAVVGDAALREVVGADALAAVAAAHLQPARLLDAERSKQQAAQAQERRLQVGSGDRSQRIRTYNFPQGRITDHRVEGLTLYDLPHVLEGYLEPLVDRLQSEHQADELARLTDNP